MPQKAATTSGLLICAKKKVLSDTSLAGSGGYFTGGSFCDFGDCSAGLEPEGVVAGFQDVAVVSELVEQSY